MSTVIRLIIKRGGAALGKRETHLGLVPRRDALRSLQVLEKFWEVAEGGVLSDPNKETG